MADEVVGIRLTHLYQPLLCVSSAFSIIQNRGVDLVRASLAEGGTMGALQRLISANSDRAVDKWTAVALLVEAHAEERVSIFVKAGATLP